LLAGYQKQLRDWMVEAGDPLLKAFDKRGNVAEMKAELAESYMAGCPRKRAAPRKKKAPRAKKK